MKPSLEELRAACTGVDDRLIEAHHERLSDAYYERFNHEEIARHLQCLGRLSHENPVELMFWFGDGDTAACTVLAYDYASEFSLIAGVLAGMGFSIDSGDVFTYERAATPETPTGRGPRRLLLQDDSFRRRRIIDHFSGHLVLASGPEAWEAELRERLARVIRFLEKGDDESFRDARHYVNEMVTARIAALKETGLPVLYPVSIDIDNQAGPFTRVRVVSQDTPAFLYALTTSLSLQGLVIEHVGIRTVDSRIEDVIDLVNRRGEAVFDEKELDKVRLSVLLTKQFTYFLDKAPDPYAALSRFDHMLGEIIKLPDSGRWVDALSDPRMMKDLARLLGASDYIWEDFIRLQYESLLPILTPHLEGRPVYEQRGDLGERLERAMEGAEDLAEKGKRLNAFKNREIFLIDLDHILNPTVTFRDLAERLSALAEVVVHKTAEVLYQDLAAQYGEPQTVGGLATSYTIMGLGKLGGAALGYASDIELLYVYSDSGLTAGDNPISSAEFFGHLAERSIKFIEAKREGIFRVDLRLRPYGDSGPKACSLQSFCDYYGPGGAAHSYERLALVRMRKVGGDRALGERLERLRDQFIYERQSIKVPELRELRERQFKEKNRPGVYNAKFSPGALVDLEYAVQILQVIHGGDVPSLRTPRIHLALEGLREAGVIEPEERRRLNDAYDFLRRLINALRLLRGSAKDLFLPPATSEEFAHLARRMGYERDRDITPQQRLYIEFETRTAAVRAFVEHHFGRESLPGPATGNIADLIISEDAPEALRTEVLGRHGFKNTERAYVNFKNLAGEGAQREVFTRLAVLACDILRREPDPDMALNNWERFTQVLPNSMEHHDRLMAQPRRLEVLLAIFSRSQYLADTLIQNPRLWFWITSPENLHGVPSRDELETELKQQAASAMDHEEWLQALRRFRNREMLRIGTRDMYLGVETASTIRDLSTLADAVLNVALEQAWQDLIRRGRVSGMGKPQRTFCILAFGKLGGRELNYSSDIDLMGLYDDQTTEQVDPPVYKLVLERLNKDLSGHSSAGNAYRVDWRLRPYGGSGEAVASFSEVVKYYHEKAAAWEIQALLKLRPVAGNLRVGMDLLDRLRPLLLQPRDPDDVARAIRHMRSLAIKHKLSAKDTVTDVKTGLGGIRDIEFLVQGLQLTHAPRGKPELLTGNTLEGLALMAEHGILDEAEAGQLADDYILLRRIEHYLQILEDRQIHALPTSPNELDALARRTLGRKADRHQLEQTLETCFARVRDAAANHLHLPI